MKPILPGAMLGLLGGGQLGRMFAAAAHQMGYSVTVLDPDTDSPAGHVAEHFMCASFTDQSVLQQLSGSCVAVTTEFENIPAETLSSLAKTCRVSPDAYSVSIAQNRLAEKRFLQQHGFSVVPFEVIEHQVHAKNNAHLYPGILKVSQFGYDGKGQRHVDNPTGLEAAFTALQSVPCVLEKKLPLQREISVILARGQDGAIASFPVAENQHVNGILDISIIPARIPDGLAAQARDTAIKLAEALNYQGVLCVEFFVLEDDQLLINEIAPRPHNSGHFSIDACVTSQFEQQLRTLCGLPLGSTALHRPIVMVNLLGELWQSGEPDWPLLLRDSSVKLHLYGKKEARPGRKMGHFTVMDQTVDQALVRAQQLQQALMQPTHYDNRQRNSG